MSLLLDTYNPSILAIPAFYVLSVLPHSYAISVASGGDVSRWDNKNPRSTTMKAKVKDRLDAETFAYYERLEACHANGMENLPLFSAAVVLGNLAGLKKGGLGGMTSFAAMYLAVRIAYTAVYASNKTQSLSLARSGLWVASVGLCFRILFKAAKTLGGGIKLVGA